MPIVQQINRAITATPEESPWKRWLGRIYGVSSIGSRFVFALAIVARFYSPQPDGVESQLSPSIVTKIIEAIGIDLCLALAFAVVTSLILEYFMKLVNTMLKPLLSAERDAGRKDGLKEGRSEERATMSAWWSSVKGSGKIADDTPPPPNIQDG